MWGTHSTDSSSAHSWQHRCDDPVCLHWWTRVQNRLGLIAIMNNACILAYAVDIHWFNIDYFNNYWYYILNIVVSVYLYKRVSMIVFTFLKEVCNIYYYYNLKHVASGLDIDGWVLSYFEGTVNVHCYTSCTLTTLHCSKVTFIQCCHMKIYNKIFTKMWGVYSLLWDTVYIVPWKSIHTSSCFPILLSYVKLLYVNSSTNQLIHHDDKAKSIKYFKDLQIY